MLEAAAPSNQANPMDPGQPPRPSDAEAAQAVVPAPALAQAVVPAPANVDAPPAIEVAPANAVKTPDAPACAVMATDAEAPVRVGRGRNASKQSSKPSLKRKSAENPTAVPSASPDSLTTAPSTRSVRTRIKG